VRHATPSSIRRRPPARSRFLRVGAAAAHGIDPIDPVDTPALHREELGHAAEFLGKRGIRAECAVALGNPATEILEPAESRNADLIVRRQA
jgi:nucleotide-binding universal stress UspA family protein